MPGSWRTAASVRTCRPNKRAQTAANSAPQQPSSTHQTCAHTGRPRKWVAGRCAGWPAREEAMRAGAFQAVACAAPVASHQARPVRFPASQPPYGHSWCMKSTGMQLSRGPRVQRQRGSSARRAATGLQEVARVVVGIALRNCLLQVACRSWAVSSAFSTAGKDTQGANWAAGMHARSWRLRAAGAQLPPPPPNPQALATTAMRTCPEAGHICNWCSMPGELASRGWPCGAAGQMHAGAAAAVRRGAAPALTLRHAELAGNAADAVARGDHVGLADACGRSGPGGELGWGCGHAGRAVVEAGGAAGGLALPGPDAAAAVRAAPALHCHRVTRGGGRVVL